MIRPYVRTPVPPTVCLHTGTEVVSEHGEPVRLEALPDGYRVWATWETVRALVRDGKGEALCWNNEEIRWRHERFEDGWTRRQSDVSVLRLPVDMEVDAERLLQALALWRDWLARYGASPTGTTGSAAWSLLRGTLERDMYLSTGAVPPLSQTFGGRLELGPAGRGRFEGELELWDLPAAYASTLASLPYGGWWLEGERLPGSAEFYALQGSPVFVRTRVRVPAGLTYGPLLRKPRGRLHTFAALVVNEYPVGATLQGVWTWQELRAAELAGCKVLREFGFWVHRSGWRPFEPWWDALERGRSLPGLAGLLAKMTGNALWGQFCMDARGGRRTIVGRNGKLRARALAHRGGRPASHDLAETVSGRVRAELYAKMLEAGEGLVSAHTDGAWMVAKEVMPGQSISTTRVSEAAWRLKARARRLDLLDPQVLRYWPVPPRASEPWVVYAGMPYREAPDAFAREWAEAGFAE